MFHGNWSQVRRMAVFQQIFRKASRVPTSREGVLSREVSLLRSGLRYTVSVCMQNEMSERDP